MTPLDIKEVALFAEENKGKSKVRNIIMRWIDNKPHVQENLRRLGIVQHQGAFIIERELGFH